MNRLSIVFVSYNSRRDLEAALTSLTHPAPDSPHEILVVDNASSDATATFLRERWPQVRVVESPSNIGFARANNLGFRHTTGDAVLFLNPDTTVPPGAIDRLLRTLDSRPEVAVVGPRLVNEAGQAELSFGSMMTPWAEMGQKLLVRGTDRGWSICRSLVERRTRRARLVGWVSGACLLIRRSALEAVGGFDERYFMYAEDVDLCAMVRAQGGAILFTPDVEIVHLRGRSMATAPHDIQLAHQRSRLVFYQKHHPHWLPLLRAYLKIRRQLPDTSS